MVNFKKNYEKSLKPAFEDKDSGLGLILFIILQIAVIYVARYLINSLGISYTSLFSYILSFIIEAIFALSVFIVSKNGKKDFVSAIGIKKKINIEMVLFALIISLVCLFGLSRISNYFLEMLEGFGYHSSGDSIQVESFKDLIIYTFLIALVPAVCEEIMFRGLVLGGLSKLGRKTAIIISALAFTLMHGSPDQTVHQFILGIVFGYVYYFSGNLLLTILIHFFNNFSVLVINFIYNITTASGASAEISETAETVSPTIFSVIVEIIFSLAIIAISVYLVYVLVIKLVKSSKAHNELPGYLSENELKFISSEKNTNSLENTETETEKDEIQSPLKKSGDLSEKTKISKPALIYFIIAFIYLGVDWILALINGFIV